MLRNPGDYRFCCFVRNPYARLLSAWRDKFQLDEQGGAKHRSMRRELPAVRRFAASRGIAGADSGSEVPLETLLAYIEQQPAGRRNHHWDTQYSVLAADLITYDRVFRMETEFVSGMHEIFRAIELPDELTGTALKTRYNASRAAKRPVLTEELAERIQNVYARDFEAYGYDVASWQGL